MSEAAQQYELDDLDRRIIAVLKSDGRATHQRIARNLRISPATVGARIRRLESVNAMRVVAVTDFAALGYKVLLAVGIQVQGRPAQEVAQEAAALPQVFALHLVTGAYAVEILVALHELDELESFLLRDLAKIRGIRRLAAGIAADVIKYDFDRAPVS